MKVMMVLLLAQLLGTTTEDGAVGGRDGGARGGGKERGRPSAARTERAIEEWREGAGQAVGGEDRDGEAGAG